MTHLEKNPYDNFDSYDLRHYLEHLRDGGRSREVHRVLLQEIHLAETVTGGSWLKRIFVADKTTGNAPRFRNCWYDAQEKIGEIHNFVKDVGICWNVAEIESKTVFAEEQMAFSISLEARYALITSCLNNLAENIPPVLLSRLIEEKILTVPQSLVYVEQIPDAPQRALTIALVASHANNAECADLYGQSIDILHSIVDVIALSKTLIKIAEIVSEPEILLELLTIAQKMSYATSRVEALLELLPFSPEEIRREIVETALIAAKEIGNESDRAKALIGVAEHLEEPKKSEALNSALEIISSFTGEAKDYSQADALKQFVIVAPEELLTRVPAILETITNEQHCATIQLAYAARFFIQRKTDEALIIFKKFENPLFDTQLVWSLAQIVTFAPPDLMPDVLKIILKINSEFYAIDVLEQLIPLLPEKLIRETVKAVRQMHGTDYKIRANAALAKRLTDFSDYELLNKTVGEISQKDLPPATREKAVEILAPRISPAALRQIFSVVQRISDLDQQILTTLALADYLTEEDQLSVLREEISRAELIQDETRRGEVETEIIVRLTALNESEQAFSIAFKLRPFEWRVRALAVIFANSPENLKEQNYRRIMEHWARKGEQAATGELLKNLMPHLASGFAFEALKIISGLDELYRAKAYANITPFVSLNLLREVIIPYLKTVGTNPNINEFSRGFDENLLSLAVAARLAELGAEDEALTLAASMTHELTRGSAFESIIPHLSAENLLRLRAEAAKFSYEGRRDSLDGYFAARFAALGEEETATALLAGIKNAFQRAAACAAAAKYASGELQLRLIGHALELVEFMREQTGGTDSWQARIFTDLASFLTLEELMRGWLLSLDVADADERGKALSSLSLKLLECNIKEIYPLWNTALHTLARRSRRHFLIDLRSLARLVPALGGAEAVEEAIRAVRDAGRWWQ